MSYVLDDASAVFTGDTLLIRGCGRTDFQVGRYTRFYFGIVNVLFVLSVVQQSKYMIYILLC